MLRRVLVAQRLWKDLGISWSELQQMDAQEIREIVEILKLEDETVAG